MSKGNQRKQSDKDNARKAYQQGYSDAQKPNQWFRWKKHPYLNEYRLGYSHGTKSTPMSRSSAYDAYQEGYADGLNQPTGHIGSILIYGYDLSDIAI